MMKGRGILALLAPDKPEEGKPKPEQAPEDSYSDEQLTAAEEFSAAVKAGKPEAIVDAFRALKMACEESYDVEEEED